MAVPVLAADVTEQQIIETCGANVNAICKWALEATGNETVATIVKFLVGWPLTILLTVIVAWIVALIGRRLIRRFGRRLAAGDAVGKGPVPLTSARLGTLTGVVASVFTVMVWSIAIISMLAAIGVSLVPLLASAGVATAALGFGAQSIVKDFLSGFFMLAEGQFEVGDTIDVGDAIGTVEAITLRRTVVRGLDGTVWHVPNGVINRVGNRCQQWSQAVLDLRVAGDTDLVAAQAVIERTAIAVVGRPDWEDIVLDEPEVLGVEDLGANGAVIRLVVKTAPGQNWKLLRALREAIKEAFDESGIAFAPPVVPVPTTP
jgi:small conductance mechanosensitive channel